MLGFSQHIGAIQAAEGNFPPTDPQRSVAELGLLHKLIFLCIDRKKEKKRCKLSSTEVEKNPDSVE